MTAIIIPRRHYTQPQGRVRLADGGLAYLASDFASGFATPNGVAANAVSIPHSAEQNLFGTYTIVVLVRSLNASWSNWTSPPLWQKQPSANWQESNAFFQIFGPNALGQFRLMFSRRGTGSGANRVWQTQFIPISNYTDMTVLSVVARPLVETPPAFYVHGAAYGALPENTTSSGFPLSGDQPLLLGHSALSWFYAVAIARELSAPEQADLAINPWQLFRADPIRIYSLPSGPIAIPTLSGASFAGRVPSVTVSY